VRLIRDLHVTIHVIDDSGVELLLPLEDPLDHAPHRRQHPPTQARRRLAVFVEDSPERVEAVDLVPIRRRQRRRARPRIRHAAQRPTIPSTGLLAVAYIFRGMRPAR
jgi:hypothetical protein